MNKFFHFSITLTNLCVCFRIRRTSVSGPISTGPFIKSNLGPPKQLNSRSSAESNGGSAVLKNSCAIKSMNEGTKAEKSEPNLRAKISAMGKRLKFVWFILKWLNFPTFYPSFLDCYNAFSLRRPCPKGKLAMPNGDVWIWKSTFWWIQHWHFRRNPHKNDGGKHWLSHDENVFLGRYLPKYIYLKLINLKD